MAHSLPDGFAAAEVRFLVGSNRLARIIDIDSNRAGEAVRSEHAEQARKELQQLAWLLDSSIPVPGTKLTVGSTR
jgi:hypothetical protein